MQLTTAEKAEVNSQCMAEKASTMEELEAGTGHGGPMYAAATVILAAKDPIKVSCCRSTMTMIIVCFGRSGSDPIVVVLQERPKLF